MIYIYSLTVFFLILFVINYAIDQRRVRNGVFLTIGILLLLFSSIVYAISNLDGVIPYIGLLLVLILLLLSPVMLLVIGIALIYNGRTLLSKEGWKLPNLLSLLAGIGIATLPVITFLMPSVGILQPFIIFIQLCFVYYGFLFICYLASSTLYNLNRVKLRQEFMIILGSGLIKDRVPPLLASRIDRAIAFYDRQRKIHTPPLFVASGGQGSDETVAEAEAIRDYLLSKGIPNHHIIVENQSVNTLQNMQFSKQKMDERMAGKPYSCVFVTNNFHLFRAGIYAREAGINGDGVGSRTAFYYLPNAFIREYIAILVMYKKVHVMMTALILLTVVGLSLFNINLVR